VSSVCVWHDPERNNDSGTGRRYASDFTSTSERTSHTVLGVFCNFAKKVMSVCLSFPPPIRMEKLGSHFKDFHEI